jgi:hypothetical protein
MSGQKVGFNPYEMLPPERTGPWGGWTASPIELLKLMVKISHYEVIYLFQILTGPSRWFSQ